MRPKKRRDSPAIDGMRIRHNTRLRMGPGQAAVRQVGMAIKGDNEWVTLIQNTAKPRIESKPKRMWQNDDKWPETRTRGEKAKKPEKAGHIKYPEPFLLSCISPGDTF